MTTELKDVKLTADTELDARAVATFGDNPFKSGAMGSGPIRGARKMSKGEAWTSARRKEQEANFQYSGVNKACVVVNMNPFPLSVNGGYLFNTAIPACPPGKPFVYVVLDETKWSTQDQGVSFDNVEKFYPWPCHPAEQACEYVREFTEAQQSGGVLTFFGDRVPENLDVEVEVPVLRTSDEEFAINRIERVRRNLKTLFDEASVSRNRAIMRRVQRAVSNYNNDNTRHLVNDNDRYDAEMAKACGLIAALPVYCLETVLDSVQPDPCPMCGIVPAPGSAVCKSNDYVFDIPRAYAGGAIEFGHVSMDRMTEEEWDIVLKEKSRRDKIRAKLAKAGKIAEPEAS